VQDPRKLPEQHIPALEIEAKVDGPANRVRVFGKVLERAQGLNDTGHRLAGGAVSLK
jgi:hypothetical protein